MSALGQAFHDLSVDVAQPDVPHKPLTAEHRLQHLQHLPSLVADANVLLQAAGCPLSDFQAHCLRLALDSLLFGEQAA